MIPNKAPLSKVDQISSFGLLKQFSKVYLLPYKNILLFAALCMVVTAIATALLATYTKPIFDDIFIAHKIDLLPYVAGGVLVVFIFKGFSEYGATLCMEDVGQRLMGSLQKTLFSHIIFLDINFFRQQHDGQITSLLLNDVRTVKESFLRSISGIVKEGLTAVALLYVMVKENGSLSIMALFGLPFALFLLVSCGKKVRSVAAILSRETASLHIFFQQIFQNILLVKSCHTENIEIDSLKKRVSNLAQNTMQVWRIRALAHPVMEILGGIAIVMVIISQGLKIGQGTQTTGSFLAFITALLFIYRPMKNIIQLNTHLQEGLAAIDRIQETLKTEKPHEHCPLHSYTPQSFQTFQSDIIFDNVTFTYPGISTPLFNNLSCKFLGKKRLALVGPSGAGKTTFFYLLLSLYRPDSGKILLGNVDISSINPQELRKNIALVSQEISLFDDTIANNIRYGLQDACLNDIKHAAALAFADEFIEELPQKYETMVGANGVKLSGGQRQRLALARAFLRDAPILLLDEATSSLDGISEKKIQQATDRLTSTRTTLIIAHRLSTIEEADLIFVMNKGAIIEQGTHRELLSNQGLYKKMALLQTSMV